MADLSEIPTLKDPRTKDEWAYIAGPIAIRKLIDMGMIPETINQQTFHALGEGALQQLQHRKVLNDFIKTGDIVMLRMEKTDG